MEQTYYKTRDFGDIYRFIYQKKECSRQQIAKELDISLPTVTRNLNFLSESSLINIGGSFRSTGGRKANVYRCRPEARYALGMDITRGHLSIVLVDLKLDIVDSERISFSFADTKAYYDRLQEEVERFLGRQVVEKEKILGMGISLPAIIKGDQKTISYATVVDATGNLYEEINSRIPYPSMLFNDANSAGLAESWVHYSENPIIYLFLSNSVGGALMINGKIFPGMNWRASEFGHMKIIPNGKKCYCGKRGCLDAYCSAKKLSDFTNDNLKEFFEELALGNQGFRNVFDEYTDYLALALNNLRMCYDCDIILGGTVGAYIEEYIPEIREKAAALDHLGKRGDYIIGCHYKTEAAAVGAAIYYISDFIDSL